MNTTPIRSTRIKDLVITKGVTNTVNSTGYPPYLTHAYHSSSKKVLHDTGCIYKRHLLSSGIDSVHDDAMECVCSKQFCEEVEHMLMYIANKESMDVTISHKIFAKQTFADQQYLFHLSADA